MTETDTNHNVVDVTLPEDAPVRPESIPELFWDAENGQLRTDDLLRSHAELEARLEHMLPMPNDDDPEAMERILTVLGRPESPNDYCFDQQIEGIEPDPELNEALHAAGFSQAQAELVYRLAAERLQPMMAEVKAEIASAEHRVRLEQHFGGAEHFKQVAADLKHWGEARFGTESLDAIASTYEGVLVLHQMMQSSEPEMVGNSGEGPCTLSEEQLNEMVADPRYWRDKDPTFIARVTQGYAKLYSD